MGKILCATRGGEASHRTQDAAIALAQERGDEVLFLYVVDLRFLDKTAAPIVVDVESEMNKMGEFLLLMARERAARQDVVAHTICRKGQVRQELVATAREAQVDLVVLGKPAGDESAFTLKSLRALAAKIEAEAGTPVRIL